MTHLLAYIVIAVGIPLNLYVAGRLWRLWWSDRALLVIRDAAIRATAILLLILVFGFIFLNNDLAIPLLTFEDTKILTRGVMLVVAIVPAAYWLYIYREH